MSMLSETLSLVISGDGKPLGLELGRAGNLLRTFGGKAGSIMAGVGKKIGGAVGKLANPLALLGGTAGIVMAARDLAEYQDKLSTLGISAGLSAEQMMGLEKRIQSAAYTTGQARDGLADAAKVMADITGDNDFAASSLEAVGRAATATSMDITSAAQAFATFKRDMGATGEEAAQLFNTMAALGNTQSMDRFARSAQVLGLSKDNFASYNALIKTLSPTMGGLDQAANAVDQIGIALKTNKSGELRYMFRGAIDKDGTIKDYGKLLEAMAGMSDAARKKVFSKVGASMTGFDIDKVSADFNTYMKKAENASHVSEAFARKQGEAKFQMNLLTTAAKDFAGAALGPVLKDIAGSMNAMTGNPEKLDAFRSGLADVTAGFAAMGGAAGKALGKWGDMWEKIGEVYNDPFDIKKSSARKVDKMDPKLRAALQYKHGYDDTEIADASKKYLNKDGTVNTARLDALMQSNKEAHAAKRAAADVQNKINMVVNIAPDGRVITEVDGKNTSAAATANRGKF
jgi:hypothetical protein